MSASKFEVNLRKLGIPIYNSGSREFELSIATANFLYRYDRPKWVVRPRNGEDVATTVKLANSIGEPITVKNGGHSYAGFSNAKDGILVDLCNMKAIQIEDEVIEGRERKVMIMSGGALWGDAYNELAIGREHYDGWVVNGGRCPLVGVSGFILGGGFGPFSRSVGMGMDQLLEVSVVTAEGDTITVGENNPRDSKEGKLFWALRGCGGDNFGIVTRLKIKVEKLRDPLVVAGRLTWNVEDTSKEDKLKEDKLKENKLTEFKKMMVEFYTAPWDNYLTIDTTWECDLTKSSDTKPFSTRFIAYYDGTAKNFREEINKQMPNDKHENFRQQLIRRSLAEQSTLFLHETLWAQWSEETRRSLPTDRAYTLYSSWVIKNDKAKIEQITDILINRIQRFRHKFTGERGTFGVTWIHIGGKISEKGPTETPYPWRSGNYCVYILVRWHEKWLVTEMQAFFEECKNMLKPHSIEGKASYVNFPDRSLKNWSQAYYGENLQELQDIHKTWNPKGRHVLSFKQHIGHQEGAQEAEEDVPEGPGSGARGGAPTSKPPMPSREGAVEEWREGWQNTKLPPRGCSFADHVPGGDQLPRC